MGSYQPFIDQPADLARLQGQRYVVLRPFGDIVAEFERVKRALAQRFQNVAISYVARPHLTLAGFEAGTALESVSRLAALWATTVRPLTIQAEAVGFFPFRIAIVRVRKTPELSEALGLLRLHAMQEGPPCFSAVPVEEWVFHLSIGYCHALAQGDWQEVMEFLNTLTMPHVDCTVAEAEVVAFDSGTEYSGGVFSLKHTAG
jgi:hypothetical protein